MFEFGQNVLPLLLNYARTGGWLLIPLLFSAFGIWYTYFILLVRLRRALNTTDIEKLQGELRGAGSDKQMMANMATCLPEAQGVTPRLVRRVLKRMNCGIRFREAFAQCRDGELAPYQYAFYVMGGLVTAAPLLGLLGTVFGMIDTFAAFSQQTASGPQTQQIAAGISTALVTTQAGLIAALPGTIGLAHLFRLYQRLKNVVDRCESHLALALSENVTKQHDINQAVDQKVGC